ncbi:MAG TPA: hypothetical protein VGB79_07905 [Allosphingosinicella sp.]
MSQRQRRFRSVAVVGPGWQSAAMRIRITGRPNGEAPEWVREAWIGVTLPTTPRARRGWRALGVLEGSGGLAARLWAVMRGRSYNVSGYAVRAKAAVRLLARSNPAAAAWWRENAADLVSGRGLFIFDAEACEPRRADQAPTTDEPRSRPFSDGERAFLEGVAGKLPGDEGERLLRDVRTAQVTPDGALLHVDLPGYERGEYRGHNNLPVEGEMRDSDGGSVTVLVNMDHERRILSLEVIRWESEDSASPDWSTLEIVPEWPTGLSQR